MVNGFNSSKIASLLDFIGKPGAVLYGIIQIADDSIDCVQICELLDSDNAGILIVNDKTIIHNISLLPVSPLGQRFLTAGSVPHSRLTGTSLCKYHPTAFEFPYSARHRLAHRR
mgnify:CR=1 FL=1